MDLILTLAGLALTAAFIAFCGWRGSKPSDPIKGPRMVPWHFLMLLGAGVVLVLVVHLVNLGGATTGG